MEEHQYNIIAVFNLRSVMFENGLGTPNYSCIFVRQTLTGSSGGKTRSNDQ